MMYENMTLNGDVSPNDFDPDPNDVLLYNTSTLSGPSNGTLTLNNDGTFTYTPNTGFTGEDQFTYVTCDNGNPGPLCDTAVATIHVLGNPGGTNLPPVAVDDAYNTIFGNPIGGNLMDNDYDPDGNNITANITPIVGPANGTVNILPDGSFTYTPGAGYVGPDQFVYSICDDGNPVMCDTATAYITVIPLAPCITYTTQDVSCNGFSDGSIDLTVTCGVSPFTYAWSNGATSEDLTGIPAGTYNVTVTGAFGNESEETITINQPTALNLTIDNVYNVTCNGEADGAIDLSVSGGTPGYTYNWSNGATTQDLSGLSGGTYDVTVTDANGCTAAINGTTVAEPNTLTISLNPSHVSTVGGNDGAIDLTVSGGTTAYSYAWSNGATTEDLTGISAGNYCVTVTDANGCTATDCVDINDPSCSMTVSTSVTNASCNGTLTGMIDLTVSNGTAPFTYLWSNGAITEDLSGIAAGTYSVTVTDAVLCTASVSGVTVSEPLLLTVSTTTTQTSCNGGSDGSIDATVSGGTAPYTFAWSNGMNTEDISGLPAGSYNITVTDANGCVASESGIQVTEPTAISISANNINDVTCNGAQDGSIDVNVSGGTPSYTFLWSNGAVTEDLSGLAGGTYTLTVTDANGCMMTSQGFTVGEPTTLSVSLSVTNVSTVGGNDGSIDASVSGGTTPYSFLWSNGATTEDLTGISAGNYCVTVTDANGCTADACETVNDPSCNMSASTAITDADCNGASTGSIDLTISNGTLPISYLWSNGVFFEDLTGIGAGTYSVTATDAVGCSVVASGLTVGEPAALNLSSSSTPALCNGALDGSIDLTVSGGTSPYNYLWSNATITQDLTGIGAGSYSVTVTDANGCSAVEAGVVVNEPSQILLTTDVTHVSCNGGNDGAIDLTVTGGTGSYAFVWSNGMNTQNIAGLSAGSYSVIVTDANNCSETSGTITVNEPSAIVLSSIVTSVFCSGGNTGEIDLTVSGGTPLYTYLWSNGAITQDINALAIGAYTVTVTDANGCTASHSTTVISIPQMTLTMTFIEPNCFSSADGSIDLTVTNGSAPFSYVWTNGASTEDISNLITGFYSVTVLDANGCTATQSLNLPAPPPLFAFMNETHVTCFGGIDGVIDGGAQGGTPPYTYLWSTGQVTEDLFNLTAGTYTVTITDANGCTVSSTRTINQPSQIQITALTITDVSCNGGIDGAINVTVVGGTPSYSYAWSGGQATEDIANVGAGNYTLTVTDAAGCTANATFTVGEPNALSLSTNIVNVSCSGGTNGSVDLSVSGGTPPFTYLWSNAAVTQDISGLSAGTYLVTVTDANGCAENTSAIVTEGAPLAVNTLVTHVSCGGDFPSNDGTIDITVVGGTGPFTFIWSNGSSLEDLINLPTGNYTVTVTDANNCTGTASATISAPPGLSLITAVTNVSCNGGNDGEIDLTISGGTPSYSVIWATGATTEDLTGLPAGTYSVTVTDANGCQVVGAGTVTETTAISISLSESALQRIPKHA